MNETYISHSGIKGQKWGVRRFQNEDGTLTEAGKERYGKGERQRLTPDQKKKIAAIAFGIAAAGAVTYMVSTENGRQILTSAGKAIKEKAESPELKEFIDKAAQTTMTKAKESTKRFGKRVTKRARAYTDRIEDAMIDAAMISIGSVVMSSISNKLKTYGDSSNLSPTAKKVLTDSVDAGKKVTSNSVPNALNKEHSKISSVVGAPTKKTINKQSKEYADLFRKQNGDTRDSSEREIIRAMSNAGYDINQIQTYMKKMDNGKIAHSDGSTYFVVRVS